MHRTTPHRVVVGVDGSAESLHAVEWAAADAGRRGVALHLVHAAGGSRLCHPPPGFALPVAAERGVDPHAVRLLAAATVCARDVVVDLTVDGEIVADRPVPALLTAGKQAVEIVLGARGADGFAGLVTGSTTVQLADHAACPVVIVRPRTGPAGPNSGRVVLGVDGSPSGRAAVRYGIEQAALRGVGLTAVHAYDVPVALEPVGIQPGRYDQEAMRDAERRVLAEAVAGAAGEFPDVELRLEAVAAPAARTVVTAAAGAELVVVGARGRGGFAGLLLGSVGRALVHHAPCPVAIVRG